MFVLSFAGSLPSLFLVRQQVVAIEGEADEEGSYKAVYDVVTAAAVFRVFYYAPTSS